MVRLCQFAKIGCVFIKRVIWKTNIFIMNEKIVERKKKKRVFWGLLTFLYIVLIFMLTFQGKKETEALSLGAENIVQSVGIYMPGHDLRSLAHIPLYFGLGVLCACFMNSMKWSTCIAVIVGFIVGVLDETVKILLPTREFDIGDVMKDIIGVCIGVIVIIAIDYIRKRCRLVGDFSEKS